MSSREQGWMIFLSVILSIAFGLGGYFWAKSVQRDIHEPVPRAGMISAAIYPGIRVTQMRGKPVTIVITPSFENSEIACTEFQR